AKLAPIERLRSARLLQSYITGFRRSRTGCVMRDVCHCAPPSPALNISTFWAPFVSDPLHTVDVVGIYVWFSVTADNYYSRRQLLENAALSPMRANKAERKTKAKQVNKAARFFRP